jgi:peptidoglycan hydrolase-like protein with peptidoglycan-binding domain
VATSTDAVQITKNLTYKSRGEQVVTLQMILIQQGYLTGSPTGYFGILTFKAVKDFQRAHNINPTGLVGPATRGIMSKLTANSPAPVTTESFEGTITAYSTGCFADGECSITVDGKKIVTTLGWSQQIVGKVTGIPDFGSIANKVGSHAKVYAKKTPEGYTLYGSTEYYVEVK